MAGYYELNLDAESTTSLRFTYEVDGVAVDLTGYSATCTGRSKHGANPPLWNLTNGSGITLGGAAGTIDVLWTDEITDAIGVTKGVWELVVEDASGARFSLLKGLFTCAPKVVA